LKGKKIWVIKGRIATFECKQANKELFSEILLKNLSFSVILRWIPIKNGIALPYL
jgi:hypothetical protein